MTKFHRASKEAKTSGKKQCSSSKPAPFLMVFVVCWSIVELQSNFYLKHLAIIQQLSLNEG
jgi:hypothetical protein